MKYGRRRRASSDVRDPHPIQLIGDVILVEVRIAFVGVIAVRGHDETLFRLAQQLLCLHQAIDAFAIHLKAIGLQLGGHTSDAVAGKVPRQLFQSSDDLQIFFSFGLRPLCAIVIRAARKRHHGAGFLNREGLPLFEDEPLALGDGEIAKAFFKR